MSVINLARSLAVVLLLISYFAAGSVMGSALTLFIGVVGIGIALWCVENWRPQWQSTAVLIMLILCLSARLLNPALVSALD